MQFLNKKTQKLIQERIPWEKSVPYAKHTSPRKPKSRSASAESPTLGAGSGGYSDSYGALDGYDSGNSPVRRRRQSTELEQVRPASIGEEELQLQLALAMSREEHEEELRKQKSDDIKLQLAIDESRKMQEDEPTTLAGLADQSRQKQQTDPWGTPNKPAGGDPWGTALPAPPGSHRAQHAASHHNATPPTNDPWASPAHQPAPQPPADPWSSPSMTSPVEQPPPSDPWSSPSSQPAQQQSSPWGTPSATGAPSGGMDPFLSSTTNGTNGTGNNIDQAFDVLSSRMSPAKTLETTEEVKTDPWSMSGMNSSLPEQPKRNKTPQEFLGANSNLVNLDELVKSDENSKKANNPFAPAQSTNPFEQQAPVRVPMSQLQANSYSSGFTQTNSAGLLPAPIMPIQPMQPQQSSNPFL